MLTKFLTSVFVVAVPVAALAGTASTSTPVKPAADAAPGCATPSKPTSDKLNPFGQSPAGTSQTPAADAAPGCTTPSKPPAGRLNPYGSPLPVAGNASAKPAAATTTPVPASAGAGKPQTTTPVPASGSSAGTVGKPLPKNPMSASGSSSSGAGKPLRVPVIATFVALVDDNANKAEPEVCLSVGALSPAATALVNYNDRKAKEGDVGADVPRLHAVGALAVQGVNALRQACRAKTSIASATGMLRDTAAALRSIDADANVWVK